MYAVANRSPWSIDLIARDLTEPPRPRRCTRLHQSGVERPVLVGEASSLGTLSGRVLVRHSDRDARRRLHRSSRACNRGCSARGRCRSRWASAWPSATASSEPQGSLRPSVSSAFPFGAAVFSPSRGPPRFCSSNSSSLRSRPSVPRRTRRTTSRPRARRTATTRRLALIAWSSSLLDGRALPERWMTASDVPRYELITRSSFSTSSGVPRSDGLALVHRQQLVGELRRSAACRAR